MTIKLNQASIEKLEAAGIKHWTKNNMDRLYINVEDLIEVAFYKKSGMVKYAYINDEKITNTLANKLVSTKIYVDATTGELVSSSEELIALAMAHFNLEEASEEAEDKDETIEFVEDNGEVEVIENGSTYGWLRFDNGQEAWVLWPEQIDDGITYFEDIHETVATVRDELTEAVA